MSKKNNSYEDVEKNAQSLFKRLSSQYDAGNTDREKKMADTLSEISEETTSDNKLTTAEFNLLFETNDSSDGKEINIVSNENSEKTDVSEELFMEETLEIKVTEIDESTIEINTQKTPDVESTQPIEEIKPEESNVDENEEEETEDSTAEEAKNMSVEDLFEEEKEDETAEYEEYSRNIAGEDTIESFKPVEELKQTNTDSEESEDVVEYKFSKTDTSPNIVDDEAMDTATMAAFGLKSRGNVEKDDSKAIFEEYAFQSTDEMDVPPSTDTATIEVKPEEPEVTEEETVAYEYTDPIQKKDVFASFREKYMSAKIRMIMAGLFAILLLVVEALPGFGIDIFGGNRLASIATDLGIMICSAALVFGSISKSLVLLTKGKFNGDSVTMVSFFVSFIISISAVVCEYMGQNEIALYNFAFAICAFLSVMFEFYSLRRDVYSFKIVSSGEPKSVLAKLNRIDRFAEEKEFGNFMGDYSDVYKVEETDFVSDFFKKRKELPSCTKILAALIPVSFIAAIVVAIVSAFVFSNDVYTSITHGYMTYWFCVPIAALASFTYPMYLASMRAYSYSSAIIGDSTPENSEKVAVVSFSDSDAFPPDRIKIKSVKVFENYHIENVIYYASSVFSKIGGPLAAVLKQATLDSLNSENIEINEATDTGIDAFVDGRHIVIGQPSYMEGQCFETMYEPGDEDFEGVTNKRVLYLACDDVVVAKIYVQYNVSADFLYIVRHLCKEGICVSIRTADPCIDNNILSRNKINPEELPVRIIKDQNANEKKEKISTSVGAIVSTGTRKGLIKTLLICDKITNIKKTNILVKIMSMLIGIVISVLFMVNGGDVSSIWPAVYQLFWLFPIMIVSKIYI